MRRGTRTLLIAAGRAALALAVISSASCTSAPAAAGFMVNAPPPAEPDSTLTPAASVGAERQVDFVTASPSNNARRVASWVVASGDNQNLPFAVIDKPNAKVFVFNADGRLRGATFALLGLARGDGSVAGIGSARLSTIRPAERTTPAGRFVGQLGFDAAQSVFWIDYDDSIAMHPVVAGSPGDHRFARLATASALDKRITFGCVNVPATFYYHVVVPTFSRTQGVVYVLPDVKTLQEVFPRA